MRRFEQMVTIYGTMVVHAKDKRGARKAIDRLLATKYGFCGDDEGLIVGDVEREGEITEMD